MKIEELKQLDLKETNIKEVIKDYKKSILNKIKEEYNCNNTVAEYLIFKALSYNVVREEILNQLNFLNEEDGI